MMCLSLSGVLTSHILFVSIPICSFMSSSVCFVKLDAPKSPVYVFVTVASSKRILPFIAMLCPSLSFLGHLDLMTVRGECSHSCSFPFSPCLVYHFPSFHFGWYRLLLISRIYWGQQANGSDLLFFWFVFLLVFMSIFSVCIFVCLCVSDIHGGQNKVLHSLWVELQVVTL